MTTVVASGTVRRTPPARPSTHATPQAGLGTSLACNGLPARFSAMHLACKRIITFIDQRLADGRFKSALAQDLADAHRRMEVAVSPEIEHDRKLARAKAIERRDEAPGPLPVDRSLDGKPLFTLLAACAGRAAGDVDHAAHPAWSRHRRSKRLSLVRHARTPGFSAPAHRAGRA